MGRELNMPPGTRNDVIKRLRRNKYLETPPVVEKYKGKGRNCYILEGLLTALEYFIDCGIRITKDQSKKENNHKSTGEIKNIAELIKKKNMDFI